MRIKWIVEKESLKSVLNEKKERHEKKKTQITLSDKQRTNKK